jgi:DNA-binding NtrC family response regulator
MKPGFPYSALFAGKRVLVVEDEYLLANETRKSLIKLGATVVGPAPRIEQALALIQAESIDAAIPDVFLDDALVFPVADRLDEMGIPFVFATAYDPSVIPGRFGGYVLCEKPVNRNSTSICSRNEAPKTKQPAAGEMRRALGTITSMGSVPRTGDQAARQIVEAGRLNARFVRYHSADRVLSARTVPHRSKSALAFPAPAGEPASNR